MKKIIYTLILLMTLLMFAACNSSGGGAETAVTENTAEQPAAEMAGDEEAMAGDDESMMEEDEAMSEHDDAMMDDSESAMDSTMDDDEVLVEEDEAMAEHDEAMTDDSESVMDLMMDDEAMMADDSDEGQMMDSPIWQTIALTNVRSGESFTLADFSGKTVFVEPMATWCTNCRRQLGNVSEARATLDDENTVFVALSVETNLSDEALANYTDETGFDWVFAVATPELVQELAATFGQSITNPPSTPHFVIRPDGTYTELVTGIESPEEIISRVQAEG